jgi:hypothetical protein
MAEADIPQARGCKDPLVCGMGLGGSAAMMASANREGNTNVKIAVYGASGYTGRLVAAELRRRDIDVVLSGRDEERRRAWRDAATSRSGPPM